MVAAFYFGKSQALQMSLLEMNEKRMLKTTSTTTTTTTTTTSTTRTTTSKYNFRKTQQLIKSPQGLSPLFTPENIEQIQYKRQFPGRARYDSYKKL